MWRTSRARMACSGRASEPQMPAGSVSVQAPRTRRDVECQRTADARRTCVAPSEPTSLGVQAVYLPRKRNCLANVREPTDPRARPSRARPDPRVYEPAVLSQIQIPLVSRGIETLGVD